MIKSPIDDLDICTSNITFIKTPTDIYDINVINVESWVYTDVTQHAMKPIIR